MFYETVQYPSYSLDLVLCSIYLFSILKIHLKSRAHSSLVSERGMTLHCVCSLDSFLRVSRVCLAAGPGCMRDAASSFFFPCPLGTVPRTLTTIGMNIIFMFISFFSSLAGYRSLSITTTITTTSSFLKFFSFFFITALLGCHSTTVRISSNCKW